MGQQTAGVAYGDPRTDPKSIRIGNPSIWVDRKTRVENTSTTDTIEITEGLVMECVSEDIYKPLNVANIPATPTDALWAALVVVIDKKVTVPVQDADGPGYAVVFGAASAELDESMIHFGDGKTWKDLTSDQQYALDDALRLWGLTLAERLDFTL